MAISIDLPRLNEAIRGHGRAMLVSLDQSGARQEISFSDFADRVTARIELLDRAAIPGRARVGLLARNSLDFMAWDLAAITSGRIPVVFAESHLGADAEALGRRYRCSVMLVEPSQAPTDPGPVIGFDETDADRVLPASVPDSGDHPDTLTLAFSSGTTGRLKGLVISRAGAENVTSQFGEAFELDRDDRYFGFLPFSYFFQRGLYYVSLWLGIDTVIAHPTRFLQGFQEERPTYSVNPPVFYETVLQYHRRLARDGQAPSLHEFLGGRLRWMMASMAPMNPDVLDAYWDAGIPLLNTYGVTESGLVAWNTIERHRPGSVGRPLRDVTFRFDDAGQVLVYRDHPLARGYFDAATEDEKETFLPDGGIATGDIGSLDEDGFLRLLGRSKSAIVTKEGKKFHPEEVEAQVQQVLPCYCPVLFGGADIGPNLLILSPAVPADELPDPEAVHAALKLLNRGLSLHMKIRRAHLTDVRFGPENGLRTRNMKLDRGRIWRAYAEGTLTGTTIEC